MHRLHRVVLGSHMARLRCTSWHRHVANSSRARPLARIPSALSQQCSAHSRGYRTGAGDLSPRGAADAADGTACLGTITVLGIECTCDDSAASVLQTPAGPVSSSELFPYNRSAVFANLTPQAQAAGDLPASPSGPESPSQHPAAPPAASVDVHALFSHKVPPAASPSPSQPNVHLLRSNILGEALSSSWNSHALIGGIHPVVAKHGHQENLLRVVQSALQTSRITSPSKLNYIAFSVGPGLPGGLEVGLSLAKDLAKKTRLPLIPTNHIESHILTPTLTADNVGFPYLVLLVTGGNAKIVYAQSVGKYFVLGETVDDSPGEALDKIARSLRLDLSVGGSAGACLERLAEHGNPWYFDLPTPFKAIRDCQLSFAGIKTATRTLIGQLLIERGMDPDTFEDEKGLHRGKSISSQLISFASKIESIRQRPPAERAVLEVSTLRAPTAAAWPGSSAPASPPPHCVVPHAAHVAASAQHAIFTHIVHRTRRALIAVRALELKPPTALVACGGVASNQTLRRMLQEVAEGHRLQFAAPPPFLCTDNATMIAWCATERVKSGTATVIPWTDVDALRYDSSLPFGEDMSSRVRELGIAVSLDKFKPIRETIRHSDMAEIRRLKKRLSQA